MSAGALKAACLLMGVAVSPLRWFLGLSHPNTGSYLLLGRGGAGLGASELKGESHNDTCSTSVHTVEGAPPNGFCQCLCPQGEL